MSSGCKDYSNSAGDATGIGAGADGTDELRAEEAKAAMRRGEALVQRMEDAHWEGLMGSDAGKSQRPGTGVGLGEPGRPRR
jgi:hypothetical protein